MPPPRGLAHAGHSSGYLSLVPQSPRYAFRSRDISAAVEEVVAHPRGPQVEEGRQEPHPAALDQELGLQGLGRTGHLPSETPAHTLFIKPKKSGCPHILSPVGPGFFSALSPRPPSHQLWLHVMAVEALQVAWRGLCPPRGENHCSALAPAEPAHPTQLQGHGWETQESWVLPWRLCLQESRPGPGSLHSNKCLCPTAQAGPANTAAAGGEQLLPQLSVHAAFVGGDGNF